MYKLSLFAALCLVLAVFYSCKSHSDQTGGNMPDDQPETGEVTEAGTEEQTPDGEFEDGIYKAPVSPDRISRTFHHPGLTVNETDWYNHYRMWVSQGKDLFLLSSETDSVQQVETDFPLVQFTVTGSNMILVQETRQDSFTVSLFDPEMNSHTVLHSFTPVDLASAGLSDQDELVEWQLEDSDTKDTIYYLLHYTDPEYLEGEFPTRSIAYIVGEGRFVKAAPHSHRVPEYYSTGKAEEIFSRLGKVDGYFSIEQEDGSWHRLLDKREEVPSESYGQCLVSPDGSRVLYGSCQAWLEGCFYEYYLIDVTDGRKVELGWEEEHHWVGPNSLLYLEGSDLKKITSLDAGPETLMEGISDFAFIRE